jgi:hypothetical protein
LGGANISGAEEDVRDVRTRVTHHGQGRNAVWCKAMPANQELMVKMGPDRFFVPPYVGPSGWLGVWLDGAVDWEELAGIVRDGYCLAAPKRLLALLETR